MATQDAKAPSPNDVTAKERKAEDQTVKAAESGNGAEVKKAELTKLSVATDEMKAAVEAATDENGFPKVDDEGRLIGIDGENPVSNENPDPRVLRGVRSLA
jgi:hypothetical protein